MLTVELGWYWERAVFTVITSAEVDDALIIFVAEVMGGAET